MLKHDPNGLVYIHCHAEFHLKKPAYISVIYIVLEQRTVVINSLDGRHIYASELIKKNV
jgi:hypothetical protein